MKKNEKMIASCLPVAVMAYGPPGVIQGVQPLRWASDVIAGLILKPELVLGVDFEIKPSLGKGQVTKMPTPSLSRNPG